MDSESIKVIVVGIIFLASLFAAWKTKQTELAWAGIAMAAVIFFCTR